MNKAQKVAVGVLASLVAVVWFAGVWTLWRLLINGSMCS